MKGRLSPHGLHLEKITSSFLSTQWEQDIMQWSGTGSSEHAPSPVRSLPVLLRKQEVRRRDRPMSCLSQTANRVTVALTSSSNGGRHRSPAVCRVLCGICGAISHAPPAGETSGDGPLPAPPGWRVDSAECSASVNEWNGQSESGTSRWMSQECFK